MSKVRIAILISGRGSNMAALIEAARRPDYPAEVAIVISNRPQAAGLEHARSAGIETAVVDHKAYASRDSFDTAVDALLAAKGVALVCLAGFMRILSAPFVARWQGRMLNIHPSLLPSFKGLEPQRQALDAGVTISGCTVHLVTEEMDAGPIIAQAAVPVLPGDDPAALEARILTAEHKLYPFAVGLLATGAARLVDGQVLRSGHKSENSRLFVPPLTSDGVSTRG